MKEVVIVYDLTASMADAIKDAYVTLSYKKALEYIALQLKRHPEVYSDASDFEIVINEIN